MSRLTKYASVVSSWSSDGMERPRGAATSSRLPLPGGVVYRKRPDSSPYPSSRLPEGQETETLGQTAPSGAWSENHAKVASSVARRFAHHGETTEKQVAMLALVKASRRFNPHRDTCFATYATVYQTRAVVCRLSLRERFGDLGRAPEFAPEGAEAPRQHRPSPDR